MERTTRKQLESVVRLLNEKLNRPLTAWTDSGLKVTERTYKSNPGHLMLEHSSVYGGYQLVEIVNETGGERTHFSGRRFSANEMWWMLYAVRECIQFDTFKAWPAKQAA